MEKLLKTKEQWAKKKKKKSTLRKGMDYPFKISTNPSE